MKLTVEAWAPTTDDLAIALEHITGQLNDGFTSGHYNGSENGYSFTLSEDEEES